MTNQELQAALTRKEFPQSAKYDAKWLLENEMGPCAVWLCEWLMEKMELRPGMRVLDMGCGKGMSSVFLAKEYGVTVVANDLWIPATDNWKRFQDAGVADMVMPIHAEAHALPYADEFFDAIISLDSFEYYGTDALYLDYITRFLKPGGQIGIVVPGLTREFDAGVPAHLQAHWDWGMYAFHTADWWARHWRFSASVAVETSDTMPDGFGMWLHWDKTLLASGYSTRGGDVALLEADNGEYFTFCRTIGRKVPTRKNKKAFAFSLENANAFGGEGGTRTLAPVAQPTPLAGAPRHQLEYFSIGRGRRT